MTHRPALGLLLCALAAGAALTGCGSSSASSRNGTRGLTTVATGTSVTPSTGQQVGQQRPAAPPLTLEEMREYDDNEGRCHDDGGSVREVGTVDAYCAFPARSNDFHLIESSRGKAPSGEEE